MDSKAGHTGGYVGLQAGSSVTIDPAIVRGEVRVEALSGSSADATGTTGGPLPDATVEGFLARTSGAAEGPGLGEKDDADAFTAAAEAYKHASDGIVREKPAPPRKVFINDRYWPRVTITIEGKEHPFITNQLLTTSRDFALSGLYGTITCAGQTATIAVAER